MVLFGDSHSAKPSTDNEGFLDPRKGEGEGNFATFSLLSLLLLQKGLGRKTGRSFMHPLPKDEPAYMQLGSSFFISSLSYDRSINFLLLSVLTGGKKL